MVVLGKPVGNQMVQTTGAELRSFLNLVISLGRQDLLLDKSLFLSDSISTVTFDTIADLALVSAVSNSLNNLCGLQLSPLLGDLSFLFCKYCQTQT